MGLFDRILGRSPATTATTNQDPAMPPTPSTLTSDSYADRAAAADARRSQIAERYAAEERRIQEARRRANAERDRDLETLEADLRAEQERRADAIVADLWAAALPVLEGYVVEPTRKAATEIAELLSSFDARCVSELGRGLWQVQILHMLGAAMHDDRAITALSADDTRDVEAAARVFHTLHSPAAFADALAKLEVHVTERMRPFGTPTAEQRARFEVARSCATHAQRGERLGAFDRGVDQARIDEAVRNFVPAPQLGRPTRTEFSRGDVA